MNKMCCNSYFNKYKLIKRGIAAENHVCFTSDLPIALLENQNKR